MRTTEQIPQLPLRARKHWQQFLIESLLAIGGTLVVTGIIYAFHLYPTIPNISIVYLLIIMLLAATRGRYAALLAAVVAFLSFDFFLVPPFYSFTISRGEEWLALFVFLATALLTSQLATIMRQNAEQAWLREREARILYATGRVINSTNQLDEQLDSIVLSLVRVFSPWGVHSCALLLPDDKGILSIRADAPIRIEHFTLSPDEMLKAREVMIVGKMMERSEPSADSHAISADADQCLRLIPLKTNNRVLGVLCLRIERGAAWSESRQWMQEEQEYPSDQTTFFWTFLDQAIMLIERASLRTQALSSNQ